MKFKHPDELTNTRGNVAGIAVILWHIYKLLYTWHEETRSSQQKNI